MILDYFKKNMFPLIQQHVDGMLEGKIKKLNTEAYAKDSVYAHKTAVLHLNRFLDGRRLRRKDFNVAFLREFIEFMEEEGLSKNSIKNNVKQLIIIVNRLMKEGVIKKFDLPNIPIQSDNSFKVYMTEDELIQLKDIDLSLMERLEGVRDLFLIQCYTSLRFSDAIRIARNPEPYFFVENGRSFFKIITKKTRQELVIPLKKEVIDILEKRNFRKMKMGIQYYNRSLKELCKFAEINKEVVHYIEKGGKRTETVMKKYELISSHTGRRTFITNAVMAGVPLVQIQAISGHTTTQSLLNYLHASNLELAKKSFDNEYFK